MNSKVSKSLEELKAKWYRILRQRGFKDIEDDKEYLKEHHSFMYGAELLTHESHQRYYELAGQLLHSHTFPDALAKDIWRKHCQGKTVRKISEEVHKSKSYVHRVIEDLKGFIVR